MILLRLFFTFFKIGAFTFGGGYAMLPLIENEVLSKGWATMDELLNFIAVSESTPGPFAINMATYIGTETAGFAGAFCATLGVVTPSFIIILLVARWYTKFRDSRLVSSAMSGIRPAVVGLIAAAAISVAHTVFFPNGIRAASPDLTMLCYAVIFAAALLLSLKKVSPIIIIAISAAAGIAMGFAGVF